MLGVLYFHKLVAVQFSPFPNQFKRFCRQISLTKLQRLNINRTDIISINDMKMRWIVFCLLEIHFDDHSVKS